MTETANDDIFPVTFFGYNPRKIRKIMLTYEKLSRRPGSFRRLTGVDTDLFDEMTEKLRPLRKERRNNSEKGGRKHNLRGAENHLPAMLLRSLRLSVTGVT